MPGNASSTILCDCEAGLDRFVGPGGAESFATPDGRPGVILQFHVPRFRKDREPALERTLLVRLSQNVLTCPTTACFNLLDTTPYHNTEHFYSDAPGLSILQWLNHKPRYFTTTDARRLLFGTREGAEAAD